MIQLLGGMLCQLQPIDPNPFNLPMLEEMISQFGLWEVE